MRKHKRVTGTLEAFGNAEVALCRFVASA